MLRLSEIKLADATAKDLARAINYSMKQSKKTANLLVGQLDLHGAMNQRDVRKLYPADTFTKSGKLTPKSSEQFASESRKVIRYNKPLKEYNLLDFANAFARVVNKKGRL